MWREVCSRSSLTPAGLHGESCRIRETSARFHFAGTLSQGDPPSEPWRVSKATRIIRVIIGRLDVNLMGFDASVNGKVVMSNCQASAVPVLQMYHCGPATMFTSPPKPAAVARWETRRPAAAVRRTSSRPPPRHPLTEPCAPGTELPRLPWRRPSRSEELLPNPKTNRRHTPPSVLEGPRSHSFRMLRCEDRAFRPIQSSRGGGTEQHASKPACVREHHDQIEFAFLRRRRDHPGGVAAHENSCRCCRRKFGDEKGFSLATFQCSSAISLPGLA